MITFNLIGDYTSIPEFEHFVLRTVYYTKGSPFDITANKKSGYKHKHVLYGFSNTLGITDFKGVKDFPTNKFEIPLHAFDNYFECINEVSFLSTQLRKTVLNYLVPTT